MSQIPDDEGMLPAGITPDETVEGTVVEGPSDQPTLSAPEPLEKWSDEDPEYVEFEDAPEDSEEEEPDDLTEEELSVEPLESDPLEGPQWVRYELWAQNLDEASDWELVAVEDVDGESLEAEIGQIPTATRMRFRLRLIDVNGGHSKWSEVVDITTPRDLTAPPAPVPPGVSNNNGFITFTSTGELVGDTPPDLSHLCLYLQQMEGGDGPGDPLMVTRFYGDGAGRWTTGNLPVVEHRAFLTAVDTTGNESPRSEYVNFTPDPPADAEAIRQTLDEARDRIEQAEQEFNEAKENLEAGLADLNDSKIPELEDNLAQKQVQLDQARTRLETAEQAVQDSQADIENLDDRLESARDSFNDGLANLWTESSDLRTTVAQNAQTAQQRADEAKEMAERALATAGDNVIEDYSFETNYWPSRWNGIQGYAVTSAADSGAPHGARVLRVDSANRTANAAVWLTATGFAGAPALMNVTPGDVVRFAIRYRGNFNNHFRMRFMDRSGDRPILIDEQFTRPTNANDWQRATVDFTVPAGVSVISVGLGFFFTSGVLVLDQAEMRDITRAYEALQTAQQAIQAAEAAHTEAGLAYALAEQAMQSTGAQPTVMHGTTPPTGTAPNGAVWFMWDSVGEGRSLTDMWVRRDGAWEKSEFAPEIIPYLDAGHIRTGQFDGDRITANSITARNLALGNWQNEFTDPDFSEYAQRGADGTLWSVRSGSGAWTTITVSSGERAITIHPNTVTAGGRLAHTPNGNGVRVRPGDQFTMKMRAFVSANVGTSNCRLRAFFRNAQGAHVTNGTILTFSQSGTNDYENSFTVPENADIRLMDFDFEYLNSDPKNTTIWNPNCRQMVDASLMVAGSVGAREIIAEQVAAAVAQFLELHADQITAGTIDADRLNVGDLAARIASVIELHGERILAGTITAREANFGSWFANNGYVNMLHAETIRAIELIAERIITGDMIALGTIDARNINVTGDLVAEIGQFLMIQADQIAANAINGMTITAPFVRSHTDANRGWKLKPEGDIEIYSPDGDSDQPMIRLGSPTEDGDMFTLRGEEGGPAITMGQDGGGSFQRLTSEEDPYLGGKPLAGSLAGSPRWEIADSVLENLPLGIQAQHLRSFSTADNNSGIEGEFSVTHLEAWITPGRVYRIACQNFEMGNRENYYLAAYYQTSSGETRPAEPTMNSGVQLGQKPGARPAVTGGNTSLSYEVFIAHPTARRIRILFVVGRYGGGVKTFGTQARHNARFILEDIGPNVGRTGQSLSRWAGSTGSIPEPAQTLSLNYPVTQTATYTLNPNTGVATRQYTGGVPRFGYWTTTNQYYLTVVTFAPWDQSGVPLHVTPKVRVNRWGSSRGHIVQNGVPSFTGAPTSFNFNTQVTPLEAIRNMGRGSLRPMSLTDEQAMTMAAQARATIVLGGTGWASASTGYLASGVFEPGGTSTTLTTDPGGGAA